MNVKKILSILLAAICASTFVFALCACGSAEKEKSAADTKPYFNVISLDGGIQCTAETSGTEYPSYTLTATVTPEYAPNKEVDWFISWQEGAALQDADIKEYFTLTPESDGAATATLTCIKSFRGSVALVTVRTRSGAKTATCKVEFVGRPTSIAVDTAGLSTVERGNVTVFALNENSTYSLDLLLNNAFNDVDPSTTEFVLTLDGVGSFRTGAIDKTTGDRVDDRLSSDYIYDCKLSEHMDNESIQSDSGTIHKVNMTPCVPTVKIEDGKLVITTKASYEQYNCQRTDNESFQIVYARDNVKDDALPYWQVTIREWNNDFAMQFRFYVRTVVAAVSLNANTVSF